MANVYLVRHGESVRNRDRIIQGPRIDAELSERGHLQAVHAASALASVPISVVYSSPLLRARQTASTVASHHGHEELSVQVVPELYEMDYGAFAGRTYDDVRDEIAQVLDAWRMGFTDVPFPGGESPVLAQHRVRPFVRRLQEQAAREDVAVVAHGRINRVLVATMTGSGLQTLEDYPQSNASITQLAVEAGATRVVRLNDTSHLHLTSDAFS